MRPDPVLDEIREIRLQIAAENGNDPRKLVEYYRSLQQQEKYASRMWRGRTHQAGGGPPEPQD